MHWRRPTGQHKFFHFLNFIVVVKFFYTPELSVYNNLPSKRITLESMINTCPTYYRIKSNWIIMAALNHLRYSREDNIMCYDFSQKLNTWPLTVELIRKLSIISPSLHKTIAWGIIMCYIKETTRDIGMWEML